MPDAVQSFYDKRIWRSNDKSKVFLTFDDGPHEKTTPWLLELANKEKIKLNFFWLGSNADYLLDSVNIAKDNGHFVGNHGYDHLHYTKVSKSEYLENFFKGKALFPDNAFRPPYGRLSPSLAREIYPHSPIIMWTWLSYDWKKEVSNAKIIQQLEKQITGGEILVFHESEKTIERIFDLIPKVIEVLKNKGLTLSTLDTVIKEHKQA